MPNCKMCGKKEITMHCVCAGCMDRIEHGPEWISVKDRLPEPFAAVIICRRDKSGSMVVEQGSLTFNGWWKVYGTRTKSVTHWMPLPKPPKEG